MTSKKTIIAIISFLILIISCQSDFEIIEDLKYSDYRLVNIDSNEVVFPNLIAGKIGIVGYIFTNCPDICPLTTNNRVDVLHHAIIGDKFDGKYPSDHMPVIIDFEIQTLNK